MGEIRKNGIKLLLCLTAGIFFLWHSQNVEAAEKEKVMTLTITDAYTTTSADIYASREGSYYRFEFSQQAFYVLKKEETDHLTLNVKVHDTDLILPETVSYAQELALEDAALYKEIGFRYRNGDVETQRYIRFAIAPVIVNLDVENVALAISAKGFQPSKGNYMTICSNISAGVENYYSEQASTDVRVRILNKAGKYVFQKTFKNVKNRLFSYKWNGKASKNNQAGVKAGSYVKTGKYRAEVALLYSWGDYEKTAVKKKSFSVSKKAPSGKNGIAKAKNTPLFTGSANVDYMAEQMVKSAGVRSSMSQDQKVKKIYRYMTTHFKHTHYQLEKNYKVHYNAESLAGKIAAYKASADADMKKGKILYSYAADDVTAWCMARRIGVCDDHAMIFKILCNHVGVEAEVCGGYYLNRSGTKSPHAWNLAVINGKTYYYDVDVQIQNYKKGQGDYYWYKKTKSQAKKNHEFA